MPVKIGDQYVTRGDRYPVRFYAADGRFPYSLHGAYLKADGWVPMSWTHEGRMGNSPEVHDHPFDIVRVE